MLIGVQGCSSAQNNTQQKDTVDPFWVTAARELFSNGAGVLRQKGVTRNKVLVDHLLKTDLTALAEAMEGTVAESIVQSRQPEDGAQRARHAHGQPLRAGIPAGRGQAVLDPRVDRGRGPGRVPVPDLAPIPRRERRAASGCVPSTVTCRRPAPGGVRRAPCPAPRPLDRPLRLPRSSGRACFFLRLPVASPACGGGRSPAGRRRPGSSGCASYWPAKAAISGLPRTSGGCRAQRPGHRAPVRPAVNPAKTKDQDEGGSRSASGCRPGRPRTVRAVRRAPVRAC